MLVSGVTGHAENSVRNATERPRHRV